MYVPGTKKWGLYGNPPFDFYGVKITTTLWTKNPQKLPEGHHLPDNPFENGILYPASRSDP